MTREHRNRGWALGAVACVSVLAAACGSGAPATTGSSAGDAAPRTAKEPARSGTDRPSISTAAVPDDPCAWIPAADVEAVLGTFAEPPRKADGCRYTLVVPESVAARRQRAKELQDKIRHAFGEPDPALSKGSIFEAQNDPRSYAVTVSVDIKGEVGSELAASAMSKQMGLGGSETEPAKAAEKAVTDWDDARGIPYGFMGRLGHVRVTVAGESPDMPREPMKDLAARVRDRIPDLPFAVTNPYQVFQLGAAHDPCSLLTRAEVEAVIGPLAIEPYRSSSNWPPLAHAEGHACAYFARGHHVLAVSPAWEGGAESFKLEKGIGGLIGIVAPQEQLIIKGPWDQAQVSTGTGALLFLKGDRLLEVHYRTSRAARSDAIKLAALAMPRLAP